MLSSPQKMYQILELHTHFYKLQIFKVLSHIRFQIWNNIYLYYNEKCINFQTMNILIHVHRKVLPVQGAVFF